MELSDFTSFIEMGATLTIAFVAVEYTKQYTCLIAQKVFDYLGRISQIVLDCKKTIDEDTIDGLSSFDIDGCNTGVKIEGLKRKKERTLQDIADKEKKLKSYVLEKCSSKSYSALSLFTFLFSLTSLFIAGIETDKMKYFWIIVVLLSFLYVVSSWIVGEKIKYKYWVDYSSLKNVICIYAFILGLGVIITCFFEEAFNSYSLLFYYDFAVYVTLFLPYINFIVFAFIIRSKSVEIYDMIDETFKPIKEACSDIQKETDKLSAAKDIALEIKGTQKATNTENSINTVGTLSTVPSIKKSANKGYKGYKRY